MSRAVLDVGQLVQSHRSIETGSRRKIGTDHVFYERGELRAEAGSWKPSQERAPLAIDRASCPQTRRRPAMSVPASSLHQLHPAVFAAACFGVVARERRQGADAGRHDARALHAVAADQ